MAIPTYPFLVHVRATPPFTPSAWCHNAVVTLSQDLCNFPSWWGMVPHCGKMLQTQELLTKIRTICVEIHNIKSTSQKQFIKTPSKGLSGHSNPSYQACTSVPNTSKSNLPLPVGCPYSRRSSQSTKDECCNPV